MSGCFLYLRVSGAAQVEKDGLRRQESACRAYAKAHGLTVAGVYREEGVSGTTEDRPALAKLIVDLEGNGHGIQTVIIERLDRLARDLMVQEAIIRDFQTNGFSLISTAEGPDLCVDDPTRKLIRQVFGAVAEYDKTMLVLKLRAARMRKKAKTGRCEGRIPYGATEAEQAVIRRMRAWRRKGKNGPGLSFQAIADRLNSEGTLTRMGKQWSPAQAQRVIERRAR